MKYLKYFSFIILIQLSACTKPITGATMPATALIENYIIEKNSQLQTITTLKANKSKLSSTLPSSTKEKLTQSAFEKKAYTFLQTYRNEFKLQNPKKELSVDSNKTDNLGYTRIKLKQHYRGIPVWNSLISLHFNKQNVLYLVRGEYFPTPSTLDINAGMNEKSLFQKVVQKNPEMTPQNFTTQKIIFFKANQNPSLAYELKPTRHANLASNTFVLDANTGDILNQLSAIKTLR